MRGGLPEAHANGTRYLAIPLSLTLAAEAVT